MALQGSRSAFPWRVFSRLALVQALLVLLALAASSAIGHYHFRRVMISQVERQLRDSLIAISAGLPGKVDPTWCKESTDGTQLRLTLISKDGTVLCDSQHGAATMDNHATRPEVEEALRNG